MSMDAEERLFTCCLLVVDRLFTGCLEEYLQGEAQTGRVCTTLRLQHPRPRPNRGRARCH